MRPIHPSAVRRAARALAACALLSLAASCGDSPTGPVAIDGTANVTATGAVSASGSAVALFQSAANGDASLFQIVLAPALPSGNTTWQVQLVNYDGRLEVGTYQLSMLGMDGNPTANFYSTTNGGSMAMYNSTQGELRITSSSTSGVRGTFSFTAANVNGSGTVTVDGSFSAKCAPGMTCQ